MDTTFGIDLASRPANTAVCVIAWNEGNAEVRALARSTWNGTALHDKLLSTASRGLWGLDGDGGWGAAGGPVKVAIDAPFGWPEPFTEALAAHRRMAPWPEAIDNSRERFERRETDRFVHTRAKKLPLSVSTDRIAYPAMRCATILSDLSCHVDAAYLTRDGRGLVAEVYPDAALRLWLPEAWVLAREDSYKGSSPSARTRRMRLTSALLECLGERFSISEAQRELCEASDDCLDALICALMARAVYKEETLVPESREQQRLAEVEGWIHLPTRPLAEAPLS